MLHLATGCRQRIHIRILTLGGCDDTCTYFVLTLYVDGPPLRLFGLIDVGILIATVGDTQNYAGTLTSATTQIIHTLQRMPEPPIPPYSVHLPLEQEDNTMHDTLAPAFMEYTNQRLSGEVSAEDTLEPY